jgi:hypothetical protein
VRGSVSNPNADSFAASDRLAPEAVTSLLDTAMRARRSGNIPAARSLLRALSAQAPDTPQVWLSLAVVAETRSEQRRALERVLALDPQNTLAQRGLARIGALTSTPPPSPPTPPANDYTTRRLDAEPVAAAAAPSPAATSSEIPSPAATSSEIPFEDERAGVRPVPALTPTMPLAEEQAQSLRWPIYAVVAAGLLIVLVAAFLLRPDWFGRAEGPETSTTAQPIAGSAATAGALPGATGVPILGPPTAAPILVATTRAVTTIPLPTSTPAPSPTPLPSPTPRPELAPGEAVSRGAWRAVLLRPEYAVRLDGSIGALQPSGRFVLALVAVANDGPAATPVPVDLFAVIDGEGRRYLALPAASTAYLDAYGRGQRGDLSMEDAIPADGGIKSVPLIFDIPEGAQDLYLVVGDSDAGWPIGQ